MDKKTQNILNESELKEIESYANKVKQTLLINLKKGKVDALEEAIADKLREEMLNCAQEFFRDELKKDLEAQFKSQKNVLVNIGAEAITAIAESLKEQLTKMVAEKMAHSWNAKKVIEALFG